MTGDKLVIALKDISVALGTKTVAGIVSAEKTSFVPGSRGFINGVISLRGEPVAVVSLGRAFGQDAQYGAPGLHKIIVVRDKARILGLDIGSSDVTFIWDEEIKDAVTRPPEMKFTKGVIEFNEWKLHLLDWEGLFAEATGMLSTDGAHV
ncbi:MAG: chemotaxis protein CheW [Deltaproteobacteria bacterium]|nr:chemotaxis protein CheW [Deltaproteobacteria bacterium]